MGYLIIVFLLRLSDIALYNNLVKISTYKQYSMAPDVPTRFSDEHHFPSPTPDLIPVGEKLEVAKEQRLKSVLLGDGGVGKTSLIVSYTTNGYPTEYVPTAFDDYSGKLVFVF